VSLAAIAIARSSHSPADDRVIEVQDYLDVDRALEAAGLSVGEWATSSLLDADRSDSVGALQG
jgi:hypothetical protein